MSASHVADAQGEASERAITRHLTVLRFIEICQARNKLNENPDGVVELPPSSVRELATFVGCGYEELAGYLARFWPEERIPDTG